MRWSKRILRQPWVPALIGRVAAAYLRFVGWTNRKIYDPPNAHKIIDANLPVIFAFWHGEHLMTWLFGDPKLTKLRGKVLISRHRDGEINAIAIERLGVVPIRGSGSHDTGFHRKGGVPAFREMLKALEEGWCVAVTGDVPKVSRVAGLGIVKLAQHSGRPIYPLATMTSRRKRLTNWDRTAVNLPFGRAAMVLGEPIHVPPDADDAALEAARKKVEEALNAGSARAEALADGRAS